MKIALKSLNYKKFFFQSTIFCLFTIINAQEVETFQIKNNSNCKTIKIDPTFSKKTILDNIVTDINFVKLETNNKCLLGNIKQLEIYNEQIFILSNNSIYIFDINGKFIDLISHKGKGPGEFSCINNFQISNDHIVINDNKNQLKILVYSFDDTLLFEHQIDFDAGDFACQSEYYYFFNFNMPQQHKKYKYKLLCLNKKFEFTDGIFQYDSCDEYRNSNFHSLNNHLYFIHGLNNTLYAINGLTLTPSYIIDFGQNTYSPNKSLTYNYLISEEFNRLKYALFPSGFKESTTFLYFKYRYQKYIHHVFYNKLNGKSIYINKVKNINILCSLNSPSLVYKNMFVTWLDAAKIHNTTMGEAPIHNQTLSKAFKRLKSQTSIMDNPIIVFYNINPDKEWHD